MADEQKQVNLNFADTKPIFADEIALAFNVNAVKNEKGVIEKEGYVTILFVNAMTHKVVGEFVVGKNTAKSLIRVLSESVATLEKQLADKSMPKQPEVKTTADTRMYR